MDIICFLIDNYKWIFSGIGVTVIITICSIYVLWREGTL